MSPGVYLELVELQEVRVHDGRRADGREQATLLRAALRQQPVRTLTEERGRLIYIALNVCLSVCVNSDTSQSGYNSEPLINIHLRCNKHEPAVNKWTSHD